MISLKIKNEIFLRFRWIIFIDIRHGQSNEEEIKIKIKNRNNTHTQPRLYTLLIGREDEPIIERLRRSSMHFTRYENFHPPLSEIERSIKMANVSCYMIARFVDTDGRFIY